MIAIIYNEFNKLKMKNEFSSLKFQNVKDLYFVNNLEDLSKYNIIITDNILDSFHLSNKKIILILSKSNSNFIKSNNVIMIQYESKIIKNLIEENNKDIKKIDNVIINCIPKQKLEIEPLDTQDATIFFSGIDKPENMVDELFELDTKVHYEIKFYNNIDFEPSKRHRLSWNVTTDINFKGIIQYKIIKEIENGCLPILLKENMPDYFFAYPFVITLEELENKELLIERVKAISNFIGKMSKDDFKSLANAIYNGIYISSNWKWNFYLIAKKIKEHA